MTLLSRILGFVRDMVIARYFGAGLGTDAFFVANRIPNLLRRLFGEGAFSQAFVPVLTETRDRTGPEEVRRLVDRVAGTLAVILFLISLIGVVAAPLFIMLFAPGFLDDPSKFDLAVHMLRITFPYIFLISLVALAAGILNSYGVFWVPAFTPVFLNLSLIAAALWLAPHLEPGIVALAWAVLAAGLVQLLFQVPFLRRLRLLPRPRWGWRHSGVRKILKLMGPAIFGSSVAQINVLFDTLIASFLVTGSVSWLFYSDRLLEFPLGVFGIALATVILPYLSRQHAARSGGEFSATLDWALRITLVLGVPATLGLAVLATPIITTLFQYGAFTSFDARMAGLSLTAYSFGLLGFLLVKILAPGFFARQNTRTPVRVGVIAMVSNMVLNVVFVLSLLALGYPAVHVGLAAATTVSAYINAGLLGWYLHREGVLRLTPGWSGFLGRITIAATIMLVVLYQFAADPADWFGWDAHQRALELGWLIVAAVGVYFLVLRLSGVRPLALLRR